MTDLLPTGNPGTQQIWLTALILLGVAAIGLLSSFFVPKFRPVNVEAKFPKNPFRQTGRDLAALFSHRKLFWLAVASAFFWGLAALAVMNIDKFAVEHLRVRQEFVTPLAAILSIGIGIGAVVCGFLSGKRIELGLVPIGAFGMGLFIFLLGLTPGYAEPTGLGAGSPTGTPYIFALIVMLIIGCWAGLYDVPLSAYIQKHSPTQQRGRMIAAYNFLTFSAMLVFSALFLVGVKLFGALGGESASLGLWMATGLGTLVVFGLLAYWLHVPLCIFCLRGLIRLIYRPKFVGLENIPAASHTASD